MAKHKYKKLLSRLLREIVKLIQTLTRQTWRWLWRSVFVTNRRRRQNQAGFVLPTVAMLLMVVALVVGAIMFRTFTRTNQVIGQGQQQQIKNAATPAIERAKAKLEYLFTDPNLEAGIPAEKRLEELLLNTENRNPDPYKLNDEKRVDLGLTGLDVPSTTAWMFQIDADGNGTTNNVNPALEPGDLTTIYAIVSRSERGSTATIDTDPAKKLFYIQADKDRAKNFIVRNGPLVSQSGNANPDCPIQVGGNPVGWFNGPSSALVYKNFQVYALTVPNAFIKGTATANASIATIQYQQDRSFQRGNKWGAWFRTDLEIAPGPIFNWNGAIHSQGNMVVRSQDGFRSFLISSPNSCLLPLESNSQITLRKDRSPGVGGQLVTGQIRDNTFTPQNVRIDASIPNPSTGEPATPIFLQETSPGTYQSLDSVTGSGFGQMNIATDALTLQTRGIGQPRTPSGSGSWQPDNTNFWGGKSPLTQGSTPRVSAAEKCAPYVDDTYRADNRYGPKPNYSAENFNNATGRCEAPAELNPTQPNQVAGYGQPIPAATTRLVTNDPTAGDVLGENLGLDGYWERRARNSGLRVIVGQRLQLGEPFGWNVDRDNDSKPDQAMYSPDGVASPTWAASRRNEVRQYVTLRDNLAAAQATAVYYYTFGDNATTTTVNEGGYLPLAFVATTVHPGSAKTLLDSTTFKKPAAAFAFKTKTAANGGSTLFGTDFGDTNNEILSNFFLGDGTNGWEFNVVPGADQTETAFKNAIAGGQPLRIALENLARLAGDPAGAFPPTQEAAGSKIVHPYPVLTMWGNFSNLRSTLSQLPATGSAATGYDALSIADKSNLHTAGGTLGMLAYNISYLQDFDYTNTSNQTLLTNLSTALGNVTVSQASPEAYIAALEAQGAAAADNLALAKLLHLKEQVERDRLRGFDSQAGTAGQTGSYACGLTATLGANLPKLCPTGPKFPSLYYLFPKYNHKHDGTGTPTGIAAAASQPTTETYIADAYITSAAVNGNYTYQVLGDSDSSGIENGTENGIAEIALLPRARADWRLPNSPAGTSTANTIIDSTGTSSGTSSANIAVPFMDKAIFDGREMMNVRLLDFDLDLLRRNSVPGSEAIVSGSDTWLPASGLVYAFREDAMREDGIARPRLSAWQTYQNAWPTTGNDAGNPPTASRFNVWTPADPPLCQLQPDSTPITPATSYVCNPASPAQGISPKPVDYYADPDRRSYGFRVRNGIDLRRVINGNTKLDNPRGLSLISDNPVYIQGNFNPHSTNASVSNLLEEFKDIQLSSASGYSNFYKRKDLETTFARTGQNNDTWRQAEIIADAVGILSSNFCDGTLQDGLRGVNTGCANSSSNSSYQNSHMKGVPSDLSADAQGEGYICENPFDPRTAAVGGVAVAGTNRKGCDGPIKVFRNGDIKYMTAATATPPSSVASYSNYWNFSDNRYQTSQTSGLGINNTAGPNWVNAVIVSGVVPSRNGQSNGGLVNFPRFLESWDKTRYASSTSSNTQSLWFSGAMIQLNFSNYATAPWDQDAWEPGSNSTGTQNIKYYTAPLRNWGYDVGLQYAPAGPVARRMVMPAPDRSELYREPKADDPYICLLRKAVGDKTASNCN
ncbi:hormogonium polysaccharide biosynthesis protein HpsA [Kamptonema formosum]|uniref:hormogonium polysaccharide biosynthesis protein HpsA n=1 Tax=Kamptonema formosum TaxID=331992 RepID=UPI0004764E17|nr:hormogonium polysaccharide biosynthesis protein HpsA [Oscillatoria sp. PCC 10802]